MSNYKDIQKKTDTELETMVRDDREALRVARFKAAGAGSSNVKTVRDAKRRIAHALTELNVRAKTAAKQTKE